TGRARCDPAAECRVVEAVGKVAKRPSTLVEMPLNIGAECAGLNAGKPRDFIDLNNAFHTPHIDGYHGAMLNARCFQTPRDIRASAKRNKYSIRGKGSFDNSHDLVFRARINDKIRNTTKIAAPNPHQIPEPLAIAVNDAIQGIIVEILGTD